jgi:hypothetical protein
MNIGFVLDQIPRRMKELGYGNNYYTRIRHFNLSASQEILINAMTDYYYLIEENQNLKMESHLGIYDTANNKINEMQHEHHGQITITNKSIENIQVILIQVIPYN